MKKKIICISLFLLIFAGLRAWTCVDCPQSYGYGYDEYSNRNYLYNNKISVAASNYLGDVTGGFDNNNSFEGKRWDK